MTATDETRAGESRYQRPALTDDRVLEAMRQMAGVRQAAAAILGVSRITLWRYINANPQIHEELYEIDEGTKDLAEAKVIELIKASDGPTVRWFLDRKAKERGFGHTSEITGPNGGPIPVEGRLTFDPKKLSTAALREIALAAMEFDNAGDTG